MKRSTDRSTVSPSQDGNSTSTGTVFGSDNVTVDGVYEYYKQNILPAIISSFPLLVYRIGMDVRTFIHALTHKIYDFLIPWKHDSIDIPWSSASFQGVLNHTLWGTGESVHQQFADFMLRHFDTDGDGSVSSLEILHLEELPHLLQNFHYQPPQTWFTWFQRSWPLMDWKLGVFLWRSCSGFLLLIVIATIVPGRLHRISGRVLRWPILAFTYIMIFSELLVYVFIRLFIRLAETVFANHKHRSLRNAMSKANTYSEWYQTANELDYSQKRNQWQKTMNDDTSYRYNWSFINELISDMRQARMTNDTILALGLLQQCTRKNVGGVMNEDLFSYTNTGEPKLIVKKFIQEVVFTLRWVTRKTKDSYKEHPVSVPDPNTDKEKKQISTKKEPEANEEEFNLQFIGHIFGWAVRALLGGENKKDKEQTEKGDESEESPIKTPTAVMYRNHFGGISRDGHREQVKTFLKRARAAYGRTALCLSGGAMMGCYHFGHVRALFEEDALPHIISGTSAGSAIAAMICTRTDNEIRRDVDPEVLVDKMQLFTAHWKDRIQNIREFGCLFDGDEMLSRVKWFTCGNLTFEEAYRKTGRILCITLSATAKRAPPVLINYITAPNVVVASAVLASGAAPGIINPVKLLVKGPDGVIRPQTGNKDDCYWDGSIDQDIPTSGLAEMFNCQFFLAAQVNPHIVPFFYNSKGDVGRPSRWSSGMRNDSWRGGFLLSALELYLKSDMRAKFHFLNDLEAAVGFTATIMTQQYTGTTTIVPQVSVKDYFMLFSKPTLEDMHRYFQAGRVAAYQHIAMMKLHYKLAHALEECLAILEEDDMNINKKRRRSMLLARQMKDMDKLEQKQRSRHVTGSLHTIAFTDTSNHMEKPQMENSDISCSSSHDDECEKGGFDGVDVPYKRVIKHDN